jgi:hypothetical protein
LCAAALFALSGALVGLPALRNALGRAGEGPAPAAAEEGE